MRYVGHGFALYLDIKTGVSSWYFKAALRFCFFFFFKCKLTSCMTEVKILSALEFTWVYI